ncbi:MAG: excinuclease ABC subunit UvrC [Bacteroidales bacterium]|nr:excinuclease ABC subunit UvrC [Bacteroidales bacterium]
MSTDLEKISNHLPEKPGVYQFLDLKQNIIYIGKAKNLKKRVSSYFAKNQSAKTKIMLKKAEGLSYVVVDSEADALLLENNLIKEYQPRYNILLKDDKTFPWICIKKELFPRVFSTRTLIKDGSSYFGPYTSALMVKTFLTIIRQLYKPRTCIFSFTNENIKSGKFKVCLEYHIGNCKGPCVGLQSEEEYEENIKQIRSILKGNISTVIDQLKKQMFEYSSATRYEEAQIIKDKIEILNKFKSHSTVVSNTIKNVDVYGFVQDEYNTFISYLKVVNGAVIQAYTLEMRGKVDEDKESLLSSGITEIKQRLSGDSPEFIIPFKPDIQFENIKYTVPLRGEKLKLLQLANRNALYFMMEQKKKRLDISTKDRTVKNLAKLKADLHMSQLPVYIECFDNSNIMGKNPVASCVVFRNGKPSKKEYRHFNIKSVQGPNDFASMEEVIFRRYSRIIRENLALPQLIVVDGGKGQLSSAVRSLKNLHLDDKITIIGIAEKLEEIYFPGDNVPLYLDKNSVSLKIIQQLRNEAHRFGINFHRDKRSSEMLRSTLDDIKGIGNKSKEILLKNIGSVDKIRKARFEELKNLIGSHKAGIIVDFYKNNPETE